MIIYLDSDFKCHIENDGTMRPYETEEFEGKCPAYIEGFRIVPAGEFWTRKDGEIFSGKMVFSWRDYDLLEEFQAQYEEQLAKTEAIIAENAEYEIALSEIEQALEV